MPEPDLPTNASVDPAATSRSKPPSTFRSGRASYAKKTPAYRTRPATSPESSPPRPFSGMDCNKPSTRCAAPLARVKDDNKEISWL